MINTESGTMDSIVQCGEQLIPSTAVEWKHRDTAARGLKTEKHLDHQIHRKCTSFYVYPGECIPENFPGSGQCTSFVEVSLGKTCYL